MTILRFVIFFLCFLLVGLSSVSAIVELPPTDSGAREYRIFMVNSYHPEYFWSARQGQGIKDALSGLNVVSQEYFMDSKRHPEAEWLVQQKEICLAEIAKFKPDLILTGDDNATKTIATHFLGQSLPVVFYGINAEPEIYGLVAEGRRQVPGGNVTGVLERHHFNLAIYKLETLCNVNNIPLTKLYLLTDDCYTSIKVFELLRLEQWDFEIERVFLPPISSFAQYQSRIEQVNHLGNAIFIYNLQTIRGADGSYVDYRDILAWTRLRLKIPSVTFHQKYIEEGLMFGLPVSGYNQAFYAGLKAKEILLGLPAGEIPIEAPPQGVVSMNTATARRLGLKIPLGLILGAEIFE
ncbi:MAG: ABC transporter substrate binding protein [Pseudomonadota bacterium]|nr:ABC transporter substrate binding protein [Pseudomonadota bacterium]